MRTCPDLIQACQTAEPAILDSRMRFERRSVASLTFDEMFAQGFTVFESHYRNFAPYHRSAKF